MCWGKYTTIAAVIAVFLRVEIVHHFVQKMLQLGKFRVDALETGAFALDGGAMFGVVPKNLWSKAYHPGDEQNRIPMAARVLLIRWDDKCLLVDTGNGSKMNEKQKNIYGLDNTRFCLEDSLKSLGLTALDVTDVLLTHLHFDHAGGATSFINDVAVPTFAKARYYVQKDHYQWALSPSEKDRASFWPENYSPLVEHKQLELLDGDGELFPGIHVECFHGHTKALQMMKLHADGHTLVFPADLLPTHAHVPVPYVMGYDNFPLTTIEEKKRTLQRAHEEDWIVVFEHDAILEAGKIQRSDKGFRLGERIQL